MSVLFSIVLPVFALIAAGWAARRFDLLGPTGAVELNRFVVYLGMPALLFQVVARASWQELNQPGFTAAFGLGCAAIFAATVVGRRWQGVPLADAGLEGLNSGYANVGFIGFPLCAAAFGPASMTSVTIAAILTVCILFGIALAVVEVGVQQTAANGGGWGVLGKVALSLAKNPMLLAPALGALYAGFAPPLPEGPNRFLTLLASAASPCALVSLGLFIGERRASPKWPPLGALVFLKLVGQPAATWALARYVFHLPPLATGIAVVLAALPTGTGPFMLANLYGREASGVAGSILMSTVLSVATITVLVAWFAA